MAAIGAEFKGKAKAPSYYTPAKAPKSAPQKEAHWPLIIGGALAGAAILLYIRTNKGSSYGTGPVLSVTPSTEADQSQIQNMVGTIQQLLANGNTGGTTTTNPPTNSQTGVTTPSTETPASFLPSQFPSVSGLDAYGHSIAQPSQAVASWLNGLSASDQQTVLAAAPSGPDQVYWLNAVRNFMQEPGTPVAPQAPPATISGAIAYANLLRGQQSQASIAAGYAGG